MSEQYHLEVTVGDAVAAALDPAQLDRRVRGAMEESLAYLQGEVMKRTPVDTGLARGATFTDLRGSSVALRGVVANPLAHAVVLEYGRRPGGRMPPLDAIRPWVVRHGMPPEAAWAVARAIARRGTKAVRMFAGAAEAGVGTVQAIFARWLS